MAEGMVAATGLSNTDAAQRLQRDGFNELPSAQPRSLLAMVWSIVREPMLLLLLAAAAIYFLLGDQREALVLLASVGVVIGITFYQEHKSERALEALRDLSSPRALVVRDGQPQRIPGREVVRGDLLLLHEGDRVAADAVLVECSDLSADESLLTGESVPVRKRCDPDFSDFSMKAALPPPGGDDLPVVYSGSLLTQGHGAAIVAAVGGDTGIGRIGQSLEGLTQEDSPLQQETRRAVLLFAALGLTLCAAVIVLYGVTRGDWLGAVLAGITLAMANLPEELPLVLTAFLALGAWRIARERVLTRHAPAIETLGAASVLCVDKTGTLTENRMRVRALWTPQGECDTGTAEAVPEPFHALIQLSMLASEAQPADPMERAFFTLGQSALPQQGALPADWRLVHEYAFTPELPAHTHVWNTGSALLAACKGAPETVAALCRLNDAHRNGLLQQVAALAARGLRVLAVARAEWPAQTGWPQRQQEIAFELTGLIGLADPVRAAVPAAIAECHQAGIRVVMMTGDYPGTAQAIAREIGLPADTVITGAELTQMDDAALAQRGAATAIFARVTPAQKLRIVQALRTNGEIVAMTGDGVNDAPALKAAHIGVAMGQRGTDVAREAASLVLLDDDFAALVRAIRQGRRIYDNIRKAMFYIVAVHVPTAGLALLPLMVGWPLILFPVHVVFLEFVIDPACAIVFEAGRAEDDVMRRPPRNPQVHLFNLRAVALTMLEGAGVLIAAALLHHWSLTQGSSAESARALAFVTVVLGNLGLIVANLARHVGVAATLRSRNPALWWVAGATLAGLMAALTITPAREIFRFAMPGSHQWLAFLVAAAAVFIWFGLCRNLHVRLDSYQKGTENVPLE